MAENAGVGFAIARGEKWSKVIKAANIKAD